jgi:aconitate decarboxylase
MAMGGLKMISHGWHSGSVAGPLSAAAASGKLYQLDTAQMHDAFGIAATQASGLMSAQYGAMVKRMHHGFASRAGLLGAALAARGFTGIEDVVERDYGGLITTFMPGEPHTGDELVDGWSERWEIERIAVKPYATMGGIHPAIDAALELRKTPGFDVHSIRHIEVRSSLPHFRHAGWKLTRPAEVIGAQMNMAYGVVVALLDGDALVRQFTPTRIDSDDIWELLELAEVVHDPALDEAGLRRGGAGYFGARVILTMSDGSVLDNFTPCARGAEERALTNAEIESKFLELAGAVIDPTVAGHIKDLVLGIENIEVSELTAVLQTTAGRLLSSVGD